MTKSISFVNWYETHEAMSLAVHPKGGVARFRLASSKIEQRESLQNFVLTFLCVVKCLDVFLCPPCNMYSIVSTCTIFARIALAYTALCRPPTLSSLLMSHSLVAGELLKE
jgi:hypothetical protein